MDTQRSQGAGNRLLNGLPRRLGERMVDRCEAVELRAGTVLHPAGSRIVDVYFPLDCVIALVTAFEHDNGLGVTLVGREGMSGMSVVLGVTESGLDHRVQASGRALRMSVGGIMRELRDSAALRLRLGRYVDVVLQQIAQTAACARFHRVEARFACLLLTIRDRALADTFLATHATIAALLGVRRVGITKAASAMQQNGWINYRRGRISVLDRDGLLTAACTCYQADNAMYDSTLGVEAVASGADVAARTGHVVQRTDGGRGDD